MKSLLKLLGLAENATEEQAVVAFKARDTAFAERETALITREQAVTTKEVSFAERDKKARRAEYETFLEGLVKEGKVLPAQKAEKIEFMCALSDEATIEFGEGDKKVKKSPLMLYKEQLAALPKIVSFKEHGGGDIPLDTDDANAIAGRALHYQEEQRKAGIVISTASAVQHVTKGAH